MRSSEIPWPDEVPVLPLLVAAKPWGLSKPTAYQQAHAGTFPCPVQRVGTRWMVLTADLRRSLGLPVNRPSITDPAELAEAARLLLPQP